MSRPPLGVLLLAEGSAGDADYLESILALHGGFRVTREDEDDGGDHDVAIIAASSPLALHDLAVPRGLPLVVLPRWRPDAGEVEALIEAGAEDVLPLAEASGPRLEATVRKALGRRARDAPRRAPLWQALGTPAAQPLGRASAWAATATDDAALATW